jgi:pectate lyase
MPIASMKQSTKTFAVLCLATPLWLASQAIAAAAVGPVGFAGLDGGTSGGNPGNVCPAKVVPSGEESLRNIEAAIACTRKDRAGGVVTFTGGLVVAVDRSLRLPSNITLQGPVTFRDLKVRIFGKHNVIVRDISFVSASSSHNNREGAACPEPTLPETHGGRSGTSGCPKTIIVGGAKQGDSDRKWSQNIWIDHNSFDHCGDKCIVLGTGAPDKSGNFTGTDKVTISGNIFKNSYLATLFAYRGSGLRQRVGSKTSVCEKTLDKTGSLLPRMRVTVVRNLFSNVRQRSVRASYCTVQVHEFNNVIENMGRDPSMVDASKGCSAKGLRGKGPESVHGAQILFENNYVSAWNKGAPRLKGEVCTDDIVQTGQGNAAKDKAGYIKLRGNLLTNGAIAHDNGPDKVFEPPYRYELLPASEVYKVVIREAGPGKSK